MRDLKSKVVLVTGAGSGIGRAAALAFAAEGSRLVLCDLDQPRLDAVAAEVRAHGEVLLASKVDVASRAEMEAFADAVHSKVAAVDVLVNNAGVGLSGGLLDTTLDDWEWVLSVNLWGVIHGLHFFVPPMVKRGAGGHVVDVASGLGLVGAPGVIGYVTSKFAVVGLSESLRAELLPHRIGVSTICPGVIRTAIFSSARVRGAEAQARHPRILELVARIGTEPKAVAQAMIGAVRHDRGVVPVALEAWVSWWVKRFFPWLLLPLSRLLPR